MRLVREHLGKVLKLNSYQDLELEPGIFNGGDIVILFNNTDKDIKIHSSITNSFVSSINQRKILIDLPPKALANFMFIDTETVVFSGDVK